VAEPRSGADDIGHEQNGMIQKEKMIENSIQGFLTRNYLGRIGTESGAIFKEMRKAQQ